MPEQTSSRGEVLPKKDYVDLEETRVRPISGVDHGTVDRRSYSRSIRVPLSVDVLLFPIQSADGEPRNQVSEEGFDTEEGFENVEGFERGEDWREVLTIITSKVCKLWTFNPKKGELQKSLKIGLAAMLPTL